MLSIRRVPISLHRSVPSSFPIKIECLHWHHFPSINRPPILDLNLANVCRRPYQYFVATFELLSSPIWHYTKMAMFNTSGEGGKCLTMLNIRGVPLFTAPKCSLQFS